MPPCSVGLARILPQNLVGGAATQGPPGGGGDASAILCQIALYWRQILNIFCQLQGGKWAVFRRRLRDLAGIMGIGVQSDPLRSKRAWNRSCLAVRDPRPCQVCWTVPGDGVGPTRWLRSLALLRRPFPRSRLLRRFPADWRGRRRRASPGCAAGVAWAAVPVTDQGRRGIAPGMEPLGNDQHAREIRRHRGLTYWAHGLPGHHKQQPVAEGLHGIAIACLDARTHKVLRSGAQAVRRRLQACSGGYFASSAGSRMRPGPCDQGQGIGPQAIGPRSRLTCTSSSRRAPPSEFHPDQQRTWPDRRSLIGSRAPHDCLDSRWPGIATPEDLRHHHRSPGTWT